MTEFKIESDIPLPKPRRSYKYPLLDMKVGDSFEVTLKERNSARQAMGFLHVAGKGR